MKLLRVAAVLLIATAAIVGLRPSVASAALVNTPDQCYAFAAPNVAKYHCTHIQYDDIGSYNKIYQAWYWGNLGVNEQLGGAGAKRWWMSHISYHRWDGAKWVNYDEQRGEGGWDPVAAVYRNPGNPDCLDGKLGYYRTDYCDNLLGKVWGSNYRGGFGYAYDTWNMVHTKHAYYECNPGCYYWEGGHRMFQF